jgi:hypothetical protein
MGRRILKKIIKGLQPSILAASSRDWGMVTKNWRRRKVPKAETMGGTIKGQWEPVRPSFERLM